MDDAPRLCVGDEVIELRPWSRGVQFGASRSVWRIVTCECGLCHQGTHVALDEPHSSEMRELYPEIGPYRHFARAGLIRRSSQDFDRARADDLAALIASGRAGAEKLSRICESEGDALTKIKIDAMMTILRFVR